MDIRSSTKKAIRKNYTALVHFHGIGEQRRYEEVSSLFDELDRYDQKANPLLIRDIAFEVEEPRANLPRPVGYIRMSYVGGQTDRQEYRFYEAYYADLIAGGVPAGDVFRWLLSLSFQPVKILYTPWRELPRLRRATLLGGWKPHTKKAGDSPDAEYRQLLEAYDEFQDAKQFTEYPTGSFQEFLAFLVKNYSKDLVQPAKQWQRRFIQVQRNILMLAITFLLTLGLLLLGTIALIWQIPAEIVPFKLTVLLGIGILGAFLGIRWFLRNYVGDLYFWTTYQETAQKNQKRRAILNHCAEYLSHVLNDKYCERVVLVGHSMGTTVAHDAILELAFRNRTLDSTGVPKKRFRLDKIKHFVTVASPIDKVYYLFETWTSKSYRYNRVVEANRGDIGTFPFSDKNGPRIHWINFWDRADVASSPLYTPTNRKFKPEQVVDNYEVAGTCFPSPVTAHSEYFKNTTVLQRLSDVFLDDRYNFVTEAKAGKKNANYLGQFIGKDARRHGFTNAFQVFVLLLPWLILIHGIFFALKPAFLSSIWSYIPFIVYLIFIPLGGYRDKHLRSRKNREPGVNGRSEQPSSSG
jgi:hypothetical protein